MNFFKLIRKHSVEIGSQKEREQHEDKAYIRPAAEPVDRPIDRYAQSRSRSTAQSTGVHKRAQDSSVDSVDRSRRTVDRLT